MGKKQQPPIGFGRKDMPDEAGQEPGTGQPKKPQREVPPPLVEPLAIDDVELAKLEYQLVEVIAALEKRVRELDHDL
jgi:hypothetical protein